MNRDLVGIVAEWLMKSLLVLAVVWMFAACASVPEHYFEPQFTGAHLDVVTEDDGGTSGDATAGMSFGPIEASAEMGMAVGPNATWVSVAMELKYQALISTRVEFFCDFELRTCDICAISMGTMVCREAVNFQDPVEEKPEEVESDG